MSVKYPRILIVFASVLLFSCTATKRSARPSPGISSIPSGTPIRSKVVLKNEVKPVEINTKNVSTKDLVGFAKLQLGVPYLWGGMDRKKGFDCSGFISYVFSNFNISVPRITYQFTNAGVDIPIEFSKPGDLILFTGSDANSGVVGHMGIITENNKGNVTFIHASSSRGVMISGMNSYFIPRFVRVNRIFIPEYKPANKKPSKNTASK
ncbi:MAG: C40 family peptidase [Chitinophagaceae bacterium]|nr:C40 family peptidase [Chitinophagaceae bacterium]